MTFSWLFNVFHDLNVTIFIEIFPPKKPWFSIWLCFNTWIPWLSSPGKWNHKIPWLSRFFHDPYEPWFKTARFFSFSFFFFFQMAATRLEDQKNYELKVRATGVLYYRVFGVHSTTSLCYSLVSQLGVRPKRPWHRPIFFQLPYFSSFLSSVPMRHFFEEFRIT